jgi:hypothetical protein
VLLEWRWLKVNWKRKRGNKRQKEGKRREGEGTRGADAVGTGHVSVSYLSLSQCKGDTRSSPPGGMNPLQRVARACLAAVDSSEVAVLPHAMHSSATPTPSLLRTIIKLYRQASREIGDAGTPRFLSFLHDK